MDTRELDRVVAAGPLADDLQPTGETQVGRHELSHVRGVSTTTMVGGSDMPSESTPLTEVPR